MPEPEKTLAPMLRKLELWGPIPEADRQAVLALPHTLEDVSANKYVVREGDRATHSCLLVEGFAYRHKILVDGSRSISAVHMRGDLVDLQNSLLRVADHNVQTLTQARLAFIPREEMRRLSIEHPAVGMALWYDTLVDASIFREWIANVARRDAGGRISHLLCEFGLRLESVGLGDRFSYQLPMTQEQLADATGLTPVHVNRTLMDLEAHSLIERTRKYVTIADWKRLQKRAGFVETYLHLPTPGSLLS